MDLWFAIVVFCLGAECAIYPDVQLSQNRESCEERVLVAAAVILQAAPEAFTIGGCVKLPLKVS